MTAIESSEFPILAQPRRPEGRLSFRQFLRALRDNALATHKSANFSADIVTNRAATNQGLGVVGGIFPHAEWRSVR